MLLESPGSISCVSGTEAPNNKGIRKLEIALWIGSLVLGLLSLWLVKFRIYSDGVSYLEIASRYRSGAWNQAINSYWSPLYSWILALMGWILRPTAQWEVPMLHLVNFLVFAASLFTFRFFLRQMTLMIMDNGGLQTGYTRRAWVLSAYFIFLWGALALTPLGLVTPDGITNLLLYSVAGIVVTIKRGDTSTRRFATLGGLLAFCYFARAAFFIAPAIFTLTLLGLVRPIRVAVKGSLTVIAVFAVLVAPWIAIISKSKGYLTFGESGKLNYGWEVSAIERSTNWQGGPGKQGLPIHATRKVMDSPPVFEFNGPIQATYPPWYDPSWWYEGLKPAATLSQQATTTFRNIRVVGAILLGAPGFLWCLLCSIADIEMRDRIRGLLLSTWWCWGPMLSLIACYSLVFIDTRYIASALVISVLSLVGCAFSGPLGSTPARLAVWATSAICVGFLAFPTAVEVYMVCSDLAHGRETVPNTQFLLSRELSESGLKKGMKIAYIGNSMNADWARLLGLRIVAEVPVRFERNTDLLLKIIVNTENLKTYWRSGLPTQQKVLNKFRGAGADAVVADLVPDWANTAGWIRMQTSVYKEEGNAWTYLRFLNPQGVAANQRE
jgi:hypothetical protein